MNKKYFLNIVKYILIFTIFFTLIHNNALKESKIDYLAQENELVYKEVEKERKVEKPMPTDPKELITLACQECGVDPILAISIARVETGNFTSDLYLYNHNVGGMRIGEDWLYYNTLIEGVNAFVLNLKNNYIDKGLTTPESIQLKYCPENGDEWVNLVKSIMIEENL